MGVTNSALTVTVDLPVASHGEDGRLLQAIFPDGGARLLSESEWKSVGDAGRAALVRAGFVSDKQFSECSESEDDELRAACEQYREVSRSRRRENEALASLTERLFDKARRELLSLASDAFPDVSLDPETTWVELRDALSELRPDWGLSDASTLKEIWDYLELETEQRAEHERRKESFDRKVRKQFPESLSQATFHEARNFCLAIADGASQRRWSEIPGEVALRHCVEGEPLQVKLSFGKPLAGTEANANYEDLRGELERLNAESVLLFHIALGLALEETHATVELDHLIRLLGWNPRSHQERQQKRREIFHWLTLFDWMTVHGRRPGRYLDPVTGELLDLTVVGKLIMLSELMFAEPGGVFTDGEPPVMVTLTAGPFVDRFRGNRKVLQDIGNVLKLTELPTGQPSGAWALSIGLALNQLWREQASRAKVARAGDNNRQTVSFDRPFTRYQLLDMFRSEPWVEDILNSSNPKRAQKYWKEAIRLLTNHGLVGHYLELDKFPNNRSGWKEFWLHRQRLDIRPKGQSLSDVVELSRSGSAFKRATKRKRTTGAGKKYASTS